MAPQRSVRANRDSPLPTAATTSNQIGINPYLTTKEQELNKIDFVGWVERQRNPTPDGCNVLNAK